MPPDQPLCGFAIEFVEIGGFIGLAVTKPTRGR